MAGNERREGGPSRGRTGSIEPALGEVGDARGEPEAEEMREPEHMVGHPTPIRVMGDDAEVRLVVEQAVDDVDGLAGGRDRRGGGGRVAGRGGGVEERRGRAPTAGGE